MGINQSVFFADIDWEVLLSKWKPLNRYQVISKFPPVQRDISLVLNKSVNFEAVRRDVSVFDVYQGGKLGNGEKAYALRFVLQGKEKTLDDKTIEQVMTRLMRALEDQLGAIIRI